VGGASPLPLSGLRLNVLDGQMSGPFYPGSTCPGASRPAQCSEISDAAPAHDGQVHFPSKFLDGALKLPPQNQVWREWHDSFPEGARVNSLLAREVAFPSDTGYVKALSLGVD